MDSDVEEVDHQQVRRGFFDGLSQAPHLNKKVKELRSKVQDGSSLPSKQTSLKDKIKQRQGEVTMVNQQTESDAFKESVMVKNDESKREKRKKKANLVTPQAGTRQKSFEDLRLSRPLLKAVGQLGYTRPTPIQQLAIPFVASGKDVVASSITGSGKTAAFLLPLIQRYCNVAPVGYIRSLIITPTRQLAIQIYEQFEKLNKYAKVEAVLAIGASSIQKQQAALRNNPDLVICTPGRVVDLLINSRSIGIQDLQMLILDEADKLLQLGFENEIKQILRYCNPEVQTVLFSATLGGEVDKLALVATRKPIRLSADPDNKTAQRLHQQVVKLRQDTEEYREATLVAILKQLYKDKVIIFFKTKRQCHRAAIILGLLGMEALELHGNLSQSQRIQAFMDFKQEKCKYLLATDLAARGLDIRDVQTVINFELPAQLTKYIHRVGRTARAGSNGTSLTLCNDQECLQLKKMARKTGDKLFKLNVATTVVKETELRIQGLYAQIGAILTQEREEMTLRKADMELEKLQNISEHQTEIHSRPRREWFQSKRQKKQIQQRAKAATGEADQPQLPKKTKHIQKKDDRPQQRTRGGPQSQRRGGKPFQKRGGRRGRGARQ